MASIELWRNEPFELPNIETSDVYLDRSKPNSMHAPTIVEPDVVLTDQKAESAGSTTIRSRLAPS